MKRVFAYYRTSSSVNVGVDKDSDKRQRDAIMSYAAGHGMEVVGEYYDAAVSGCDIVMDRPEFARMVADCERRDIGFILVETPNRFSRDLVVGITGYEYLRKRGIVLVPVDAPTYYTDETPTSVLVRNVLAAISQFEHSNTVKRLREARDRKRALTGRCGGKRPRPIEHVREACRLRSTGRTYSEIGPMMRDSGMLSETGGMYGVGSVRALLRAGGVL